MTSAHGTSTQTRTRKESPEKTAHWSARKGRGGEMGTFLNDCCNDARSQLVRRLCKSPVCCGRRRVLSTTRW